MFVCLVRLTRNHMFVSCLFRKIFKNALGQLIPNCPPKHVITSTNENANRNLEFGPMFWTVTLCKKIKDLQLLSF